MQILTLRYALLILTLTLSGTALGMSPTLEAILAGVDSVPNRSQLLMVLDNAVDELEATASNESAPLYHRIRATSFLSTLNADGGRDALLRLCDQSNPEIRRHAVYGLLRSTPGELTAQEWGKVSGMLQTDSANIKKDIVRGFRWSHDPRSAERLSALSLEAGPLKSLAIHVAKRRAVLMKAPVR